jgi:hypothetical protein
MESQPEQAAFVVEAGRNAHRNQQASHIEEQFWRGGRAGAWQRQAPHLADLVGNVQVGRVAWSGNSRDGRHQSGHHRLKRDAHRAAGNRAGDRVGQGSVLLGARNRGKGERGGEGQHRDPEGPRIDGCMHCRLRSDGETSIIVSRSGGNKPGSIWRQLIPADFAAG